jgi:hypothetical protein
MLKICIHLNVSNIEFKGIVPRDWVWVGLMMVLMDRYFYFYFQLESSPSFVQFIIFYASPALLLRLPPPAGKKMLLRGVDPRQSCACRAGTPEGDNLADLGRSIRAGDPGNRARSVRPSSLFNT